MDFKCDFEKEPCVIDETLIYNAVIHQGPQNDIEKAFKDESVDNVDVTTLRLDFFGILQISNLWTLSALVELHLSNNMIEKIENLESLIYLKELDLSFNCISQIENLDSLINLEIFSIFENKIKRLENMCKLQKLMVLSAGNNKLSDISNLVYLRRFKNLKSLNLSGNPMVCTANFQSLICAYLPNLVYYEYHMILEAEKKRAQEIHGGDLIALIDEEKLLECKELSKRRDIEQEEMNKAAFVEYLSGNQLFDAMFSQDPEGQALLLMGDEILENYKEYMKNFGSVTSELHKCGLEHYSVRRKEISEFDDSVKQSKQSSFSQSRELLETFLIEKNEMLAKIKTLIDTDEDDKDAMALLSQRIQIINENFQELCLRTWRTLMDHELYLFEAIERVNKKLEVTLTQQMNEFIEAAQASFSQLRSLEVAFFEGTAEVADRYLIRLTLHLACNKDTAISEKLLSIMSDKESLGNAISASHDLHLQVIDARDDQLLSSARTWLQHFLDQLILSEIGRNRSHIAEINHFLDSQKVELHAMLSTPMLPQDLHDAL